MAFLLYTGNRLELLSERLARILKTPLPDPFQPDIVMVQSKGMEHWLRLEISARNGICAQIEFPFPKAFAYDLFAHVAEIPEEPLYDPDIMMWRIMHLLPVLLDKPAFAPLCGYINGENADLKRYQLAQKIAVLFDQYLIYRPGMIGAWEQCKEPAGGHERWQAQLWRELVRQNPAGERPVHHASLKDFFVRRMEEGPLPDGFQDRVCAFGISSLPPYYLEVLTALARHRDVHLFQLSPCREYWEYAFSEKEIVRFSEYGLTDEDLHLETGNALLASMGTTGREFFSLVIERAGDEEESFFEEPGSATLLSCIQSDIVNLYDRRSEKNQEQAQLTDDRSIQIHSCHSPFREVEVLYSNLLCLFEEKEDLRPKDIVVMMPDVARYAPFIQAIFDTPEEEKLRIPYSIADIPVQEESRIARSFMTLLSLDRERFSAASVLDLFETGEIHRRYGLTETDIPAVQRWVSETGICWGIDAQYRQGLDLPAYSEHTWRFGLDRMLLGYALPPTDQGRLFAGIVPYGEIEGDSARLLGGFAQFAEDLFAWAESSRKKRTLRGWSNTLSELLTTFFVHDTAAQEELQEIRNLLSGQKGLYAIAQHLNDEEAFPLEVIRNHLADRLQGTLKHHGYISSGVTFCTMLPMRSIPFKVVCLLGMNDGDYPRAEQKYAFNLMPARRKLCDRSKRREDRYLFLETLLSARQNLLISYVGQSLQDNSDLPPSVLVAELLDYIRQGWGSAAADGIVIQHRLHPFSPRYFSGEGSLFSYSRNNVQAAEISLGERTEHPAIMSGPLPPRPVSEAESVSLEELCNFFTGPQAYFLRNRLNITLLQDAPAPPPVHEPFSLNNLQAYIVREHIVSCLLEGGDPEAVFTMLSGSGMLPHGARGRGEFMSQLAEAEAFRASCETYLHGGPLAPQDITLTIEGPVRTLTCSMSRLYPSGQLFFRAAHVRAKERLRAWLYHLTLQCCRAGVQPGLTRLVGKDRTETFTCLDPAEALKELSLLAALYDQGMSAPLCFFPETSYAYAEALNQKGENQGDALKAAHSAWQGRYDIQGEGNGRAERQCFTEDAFMDAAFAETACAVYGPLLRTIETTLHENG